MLKVADLTWSQMCRAVHGEKPPGVAVVFWDKWNPGEIYFVTDDREDYRIFIEGRIERLVPVTRLEWQEVTG